jgi:hypothetical protein
VSWLEASKAALEAESAEAVALAVESAILKESSADKPAAAVSPPQEARTTTAAPNINLNTFFILNILKVKLTYGAKLLNIFNFQQIFNSYF